MKHSFEIAELFTKKGIIKRMNLSEKQINWIYGVRHKETFGGNYHCFEFGGEMYFEFIKV